MKALAFQLRLLEPVLATRVGGGDPNSAVGFEFIPGAMMRGMVIGRYMRQNAGNAADENFRRLFLDGSARFLNAYPQASTSKRALPTPLAWHIAKDEAGPIYDFAVEVQGNDRQWEKVSKPFCYLWQSEDGGGKAELYTPDSHINIHTAREDRQRITKGDGTVFRYQALASGQTFCGVIVAEREADLETLKHWLPEGEIISLGGSHLAGYGQARLEQMEIQDDWLEYTAVGDDSGSIIVTLLSDALIRHPQTGAYVATLEPVLGCAHDQAFMSVHVVGGFNRKWNLPLPQTQAIQAGSVFVYPGQPELQARLQTLVTTGIGERRAEGFGRIAVNWHRRAEITLAEPKPSPPLPFTLQEGPSADLARRMVGRMLREQLDRTLIAAANVKIEHPPSNAQLSRMRIVARRALSQSSPRIITQHLDGIKKAARDQFQSARIGNERLDEWLRVRAEDVQSIWQLVKADRKPIVGGVQPELTDTLALEYTARLIDRVLRKAQKEAAND
jgi:CRISPR-associated protein Csx10